MKWLVLALVACNANESPKPSSTAPVAAPGPAWNEELERALNDSVADVSKAYLAVKQLRKTQAEGDLAFPSGPLPALDFESGEAMLATDEHSAREPITEEARFRIVHLADDPWRLARLATGMFASAEERAMSRAAAYRPTIERLRQAKYVVFVVGESKAGRAGFDDRIDEPARFDGVALVYELASTTLLAGLPLHVESRTGMKVDTTASYFRRPDVAMLDLEARTREALWAALRTRSPAVKPRAIAYVQIDD